MKKSSTQGRGGFNPALRQIAAPAGCLYTAISEPTISAMVLKYIRRLILLAVLLPLAAAAGRWQFDDVARVVAISDVHGAYSAMLATLSNAGILDAELRWSGGKSHLVIVGDILDRGAGSREAMDLLMRLEGEAAAAGGQVHVLIGNHEAMNLVGDLRYTSKEEFAAFASEETQDEREHWLAAYAARQTGGEVTDELRAKFDDRFPAGFFAHRRAFAADGTYGAWLLSKPIIIVINGTAFVHGGLSPMIADIGLEGVNETLHGELARYVRDLQPLYAAGILLPTDNFYSHPKILHSFMPAPNTDAVLLGAVAEVQTLAESDVHAPNGPLWYRGNVACTRVVEEDRLESALKAIAAERVVIGHTPTIERRVLQRFGGEVIEIDTGMLNERYGGSGNALIIEGERLSVINQASTEAVVPQPQPRQVGNRPGGFLSVEATESLLAGGEISNQREDATGRSIVTVSDGTRSLDAVFTKRSGRDNYPDLAAYRLDRLLELNMVPVTVMRKIGRDEGSLQFLPPKLMDEQQRAEAGRGADAMCPLPVQWSAMYVFDTLIFNEGRTPDRMGYGTDDWQLVLLGHDRAFGTSKGRPRHLKDVDLGIGAGWRVALGKLTDEVIERDFADVLDKRRRDALATRRDALLAD